MIKAGRDAEYRNHKFLAALKGIDLDQDAKNEQKDRFEAIQRRAEARLAGKTPEEVADSGELDFSDFGFEVETD